MSWIIVEQILVNMPVPEHLAYELDQLLSHSKKGRFPYPGSTFIIPFPFNFSASCGMAVNSFCLSITDTARRLIRNQPAFLILSGINRQCDPFQNCSPADLFRVSVQKQEIRSVMTCRPAGAVVSRMDTVDVMDCT